MSQPGRKGAHTLARLRLAHASPAWLKGNRNDCYAGYTSNLISVYQSIVEPYSNYCSIFWSDYISDRLTDKLQVLKDRAARVVTGSGYMVQTKERLTKLGWLNLKERRTKQKPS